MFFGNSSLLTTGYEYWEAIKLEETLTEELQTLHIVVKSELRVRSCSRIEAKRRKMTYISTPFKARCVPATSRQAVSVFLAWTN